MFIFCSCLTILFINLCYILDKNFVYILKFSYYGIGMVIVYYRTSHLCSIVSLFPLLTITWRNLYFKLRSQQLRVFWSMVPLGLVDYPIVCIRKKGSYFSCISFILCALFNTMSMCHSLIIAFSFTWCFSRLTITMCSLWVSKDNTLMCRIFTYLWLTSVKSCLVNLHYQMCVRIFHFFVMNQSLSINLI